MRAYLSFWMHFTCVVGFFSLAWFIGVDISAVIPVILGIYAGSKTAQKISGHVSASRDVNCNSAEVIKALDAKE